MANTTPKVALITGGSRGIGLGIARELALSGYDLAINGVREENQVADVLEDLRRLGVKAIYCRGNIASAIDRQSIANTVNENFGQLNVLINNAGIAPKERRDILEASEQSFDQIISTNLKGPYFLTQKIATWMLEQKLKNEGFSASIINISSISSTIASVNRGDYCLSKAAVSMMTKLYATRLGDADIPVYEIQPGIIKTDMTDGVTEKYDRLIENGLTIQKRWGSAQDIGKAAAALANGKFLYSSGQIFVVDGGLNVQRL